MRAHEQDTRLLRLIVLAVLILIFISIAANRIWGLRLAAERVGVLHTVGSLRSALGMKMSEVVVREGAAALVGLHQHNPMRLWQLPPPNYLGEFHTSEAPQERGIWYFDLDQRMLIYRVRFAAQFSSSNPLHPDLARYQLRADYHDTNGNGQFDAELETLSGLDLVAADHYSWPSATGPDAARQP
ncbi:MAG: hypothetical protein OQL08_05180 [Gammaproteobacteria bacterium]|nr:hypothetical protein [Gammaproteobacteria bacterium]